MASKKEQRFNTGVINIIPHPDKIIELDLPETELPVVTIVMIKYLAPEHEVKTVNSVVRNTNYPFSLVIYDNAKLNWEISKVWNKIISAVNTEFICLLNNDVFVTPNWLSDMVRLMNGDSKIGAVGPSTSSAGSPQNRLEKVKESLSDEEIMKWWAFFREKYGGGYTDCEISGFCYLFRKSTWNKIGGFNEEFHHYGQENEFSYWVRHIGLRTVWAKWVYVHHFGSVSFKKSVEMGIRKEAEERKVAKQLLYDFTKGPRRIEREERIKKIASRR